MRTRRRSPPGRLFQRTSPEAGAGSRPRARARPTAARPTSVETTPFPWPSSDRWKRKGRDLDAANRPGRTEKAGKRGPKRKLEAATRSRRGGRANGRPHLPEANAGPRPSEHRCPLLQRPRGLSAARRRPCGEAPVRRRVPVSLPERRPASQTSQTRPQYETV